MSSDPNLILRLLREIRAEMDNVHERFDHVDERLETIEHSVGGMAAHLFAVTSRLADHERRIKKLEGRPSKS